jgi:fermentation-respiration switch protein FrsA (DUF1100 family)
VVRSAVDPGGVAERRASLDHVLSTAAAALQRWRSSVSALAVLDSAGAGTPTTELRGLAAWYERLCADEQYANPAPSEALEALQRLERRSDVPGELLGVVRRAVRVAEELARCREVLAVAGGNGRAGSLAVARLEVALNAAVEHTAGRPPGS